jgi:hypothetical protein
MLAAHVAKPTEETSEPLVRHAKPDDVGIVHKVVITSGNEALCLFRRTEETQRHGICADAQWMLQFAFMEPGTPRACAVNAGIHIQRAHHHSHHHRLVEGAPDRRQIGQPARPPTLAHMLRPAIADNAYA